jgi:hypothetical protein
MHGTTARQKCNTESATLKAKLDDGQRQIGRLHCKDFAMARTIGSTLFAAGLTLAPALTAGQAHAQPSAQADFKAAYTIAVARIPIGNAAMTGSIGADEYVISMSGRTSGLARVVTSGEGSMTATGSVSAGKLLPLRYTSKSTADDDTLAVTMTFKDGNVSELEASEPPPGEDRVVLTMEHRRQVLDPLSTLLIPVGDGGVSEVACRRVLPVFDGRRRYDLSLSFKRVEQVKAGQGYAGPAAVCSVSFQPIAGHRRSSPLLTFLTDGRDVEMALAPIAGTRVLAPFRIMATYVLGNVVMQATRFEATATNAPTRASQP